MRVILLTTLTLLAAVGLASPAAGAPDCRGDITELGGVAYVLVDDHNYLPSVSVAIEQNGEPGPQHSEWVCVFYEQHPCQDPAAPDTCLL